MIAQCTNVHSSTLTQHTYTLQSHTYHDPKATDNVWYGESLLGARAHEVGAPMEGVQTTYV